MSQPVSLKYLLKRFKPILMGYKFRFMLAIFGMILAALAQAESAHIIEPILNQIFANKDDSLLYILPFGVFGLYFLKNLGLYLQSTNMGYIGINIANTLRKNILEKLIFMDLKFFKTHSSGELISRSLNDLNSLRMILANFLPDLIREFFTAIGLICVVIYQSPALAFFAFIILPAALIPIKQFSKRMRKIGIASQQNYAELTSSLGEIFANIELIKASNAENIEQNKFAKHSDEVSHIAYKGIKLDALTSPTMETFGSLGVAAVLIIGGHEVMAGKMEVGNFFSFLTALFLLYQPIRRISSIYANLQMNLAASARTLAMLDLTPEIKDAKLVHPKIASVLLKDVCLHYDEKQALKNINLSLQTNHIYALIGRSGSGKSTLINALLRFYEISSGEILLDGIDIKDFKLASLRDNIALVSQNIYLFSGTIASNIAYAKEIDEAKIIAALKAANAYEFVSELGGINAVLNENASSLSGGQRQRLALARAFYKDASVMIFDEATSALDNASSMLINQSILEHKEGKIYIIIAHRMESIAIADRVFVLDNGELKASGSLTELEQNQYFRLLKGELDD